MNKLSDYFAILRLIESARQGGNPKAGQLYRYLDPSIYNQGLSTGMLRGSDGTGGGGSLPSEVINFVPQNKRNPKRAGMEYMSDGGSVPVTAAEKVLVDLPRGQHSEFLTPLELEQAKERQRLREQAFDNEFAIEVAAQSNYATDIDPSISRFQGIGPEGAPGYEPSLRGFYVKTSEGYPEGSIYYDRPRQILYDTKYKDRRVLGLPPGVNIKTIFPEAGTVSAIDSAATPTTYAHEYRHKNFPGLSEREVRVADFLTALNDRQLFDMLDFAGPQALDSYRYALRFERDNPGYGVGAKIFGAEWDYGARSTRQGIHEYRDQYIRARIQESPAIKLLNEYEALLKYNEELPEQNQERIEERQEREAKAAVRNYADGGEAEKEYLYGVGPEGSGIGQLLSPLLPVRREVIEPYQETFSDSYVGPDGQVYVDRTITPGQYGEAEFAVPQAVQAFMNFKGLARDPEAREAVLRGIAALPEIAAELPRRYQISAQAALEGKEQVYDPQTESVVDSSEALLAAPLLMAPASALTIPKVVDQGGVILGVMGGSRAKGPVGKAAKEAEEMFEDGRRETAVYRKTGAIRLTENKPGVFIDPVGEGGLDTSKFEELINRTGGVHGSMTVLEFPDYVDFPNVLEAYPEFLNSRIEFLDATSPLWENTTSPILAVLPEAIPTLYASADAAIRSEALRTDEKARQTLDDPLSPTFYVKTSFNVRDNTHTPRIYTNPKAAFALAIQDYISQKEGFVRPKSLNPLEQQSESAKDARDRAARLQSSLERPQGYSGPRQMLSPMDEYRIAQLRYPATIEEGTTSDLAERREDAMRFDSQFDDADEYKRDVIKAYGMQEPDKYPIYFGDLMGDLGRPPKFTIEYESPLFDIVENLSQEKGTGNQFLAAIKKAGAKQEDLLYSGLEVFLTNRKSVTKSEIRDRLYEREVPVYEKFLVDEEGEPDFYPTAYTTGSSNDDFKLAPEAQLRDPRSLALVTQTDPLTGTAADGSTVGLHDKLPENTFAHMRFNTRTVRVNGEPVEVLFIDEIQSDWHQRGAKMVGELIEVEAPNPETGKKSGKIIGGLALEELALEKLVQEHQSTFLDEAAEIMHKVLKEDESFISAADAPLYEISVEELKRTFRSDGKPKSYFPQNVRKAYFLKLKEKYDISDAEIKSHAKKKVYGNQLPDAAFKDNWYELSFRRLVREAVEEGLDGVAFTPDYLQEARYPREFKFYDNVLAPYVKKYAKRNGTTLETAGLRFASDEAMEAVGYSSDLPVYYMPLSDEIKKLYRKPIPTYAMGGGVASMAPVATNMFRGYDDARRGVGAYAPLIRRA